MSMNKHTALVLGIQLSESEGKLLLERFYEFEENPELDSKLNLIWGEGSKYWYLGQLLATSEPYSDDVNIGINLDLGIAVVGYILYNLKKEYNLDKHPSDVGLWFFDYWG